MAEDKWLHWAKQIQALAQAGLAFSKDAFDLERYQQLRDISLEIMANYSNTEFNQIKDLFHEEVGYQTPKADVRGVVFKDEKILLVKEKNDSLWSLPGGFCDIGLSPVENVVKEIKEEAGFDVQFKKLLTVYDYLKHPHPPQAFQYYKFFIQCEIVSGYAKKGMETMDVQFFAETELPSLSTKRNTVSQIKSLFDFLRDPKKATIID